MISALLEQQAPDARPYSIDVDIQHNLIRMRLWGFWDRVLVEQFAGDQQRAVRLLRCASGAHLILCESAGPPQSQDVITAMQDLIINIPNKAARFALIPSSAISELQGKRLLVRPGMALFSDVVSAEDWLFGRAEFAEKQTGSTPVGQLLPPRSFER